jgi:hypothetical protein
VTWERWARVEERGAAGSSEEQLGRSWGGGGERGSARGLQCRIPSDLVKFGPISSARFDQIDSWSIFGRVSSSSRRISSDFAHQVEFPSTTSRQNSSQTVGSRRASSSRGQISSDFVPADFSFCQSWSCDFRRISSCCVKTRRIWSELVANGRISSSFVLSYFTEPHLGPRIRCFHD